MEYEYSFKVDNLDKYMNYCISNNYELVEESSQIRTLYRNNNGIMARITTKEKNNIKKTYLDFKDGNNSDEILKISRETIPLLVTEENKEAIDSILDILEYKKDNTLIRNRVVYKKDGVTFELDDYIEPKMKVVALEGIKEEVDIVYNELKDSEV